MTYNKKKTEKEKTTKNKGKNDEKINGTYILTTIQKEKREMNGGLIEKSRRFPDRGTVCKKTAKKRSYMSEKRKKADDSPKNQTIRRKPLYQSYRGFRLLVLTPKQPTTQKHHLQKKNLSSYEVTFGSCRGASLSCSLFFNN